MQITLIFVRIIMFWCVTLEFLAVTIIIGIDVTATQMLHVKDTTSAVAYCYNSTGELVAGCKLFASNFYDF